MGQVWRARQIGLDREVAVKTLRSGLSSAPQDRERFRREALAVARLRHPGIVTLFEVGEDGGELFLAMELVQGETLAQRLEAGPLDPWVATQLVRDLADAVQHAHAAGVIHRDLKPGNILLDAQRGGAPRLADFGIARLEGELHGTLTATQESIGTLSYLAPEQTGGRRQEQGPATDLYGLGAILYHTLTGRPPLQAETTARLLRAILESDPLPLRIPSSPISRDLETICLKCLAKEPNQRLRSAAELRDELNRILRGEPILSRPSTPTERMLRWARRRPALALALGATGLALLIGLGATSWQWRRAERMSASLLTQLNRAENTRADDLFGSAQPREAMALLAQTLRRDSDNAYAQHRIVAALTQRSWARLEREFPTPIPLSQIAWSPNGSNLVSAGPSGAVHLWEASRGPDPVPRWTQPPGPVRSLGYSPSGEWIYSHQDSGAFRLWSLGADSPWLELGLTNSGVVKLGFHPRKPWIAFARTSGVLELWDLRGRTLLREWHLPGPIRDLDFSTGGQWLAAVDAAGTAQVWATETGVTNGAPLQAEGPLLGVDWSPNGDWLALTTETNRTVELWTWPKQEMVRRFRHDANLPCRFNREGEIIRYLASTRAILASLPGGNEAFRVQRVDEAPKDWRLSRDGLTAVALALGKYPLPYSSLHGSEITEPLWTAASPSALHLSPNGRKLAVVTAETATIWRIAGPQSAGRRLLVSGEVIAAQFTPDSEQILCCDRSGRIITQQLDRPDEVSSRIVAETVWIKACFSTDARWLAVVDRAHHLEILDTQTGQRAAGPWPLEDSSVSLASSVDGRWWAVGQGAGVLHLIDRREPQIRTLRWPSPDDTATSTSETVVEFSPDGRSVAAGFPDGRVLVVSVPEGTTRLTLIHTSGLRKVHFSPDGKWLAAAGKDGGIQLWDTASGAKAGPVLWHDDEALDVRFDVEGHRLATTGKDRSLRLWEVPGGRRLHRLVTAADPHQVAWEPQGDRVAVVTGGSGNRFWDADSGLTLSERLWSLSSANRLVISPDGRWIGFWKDRGGGLSLNLVAAPPSGGSPAWLPELTEAVAGVRLGSNNSLEPITSRERLELESRLRQRTEPDPFWSEFLQRFLEAP